MHELFAAPAGGAAVALGDLDNDGHEDVVFGSPNGEVYALFDGSAGQEIYTAGALRSLVLGDMDGDGLLDIVVGDYADDSVAVLSNAGGRNFKLATTVTTGDAPHGLQLSDVNRDGKIDILSANLDTLQSLSVALGGTGGTFGSAASYGSGGALEVTMSDFNGDGVPDAAISGYGVLILLNNGSGGFADSLSPYQADAPASVCSGDFNHDGIADLAGVYPLCVPGDCSGLGIRLGNGDGTFGEEEGYTVGVTPIAVVTADVNNDGILDLIVVNSGGAGSM